MKSHNVATMSHKSRVRRPREENGASERLLMCRTFDEQRDKRLQRPSSVKLSVSYALATGRTVKMRPEWEASVVRVG